nr:hypothetical protein [uncultured Sphingomonas sp.]
MRELTDSEIEWVNGGVAPYVPTPTTDDHRSVASRFLSDALSRNLWTFDPLLSG